MNLKPEPSTRETVTSGSEAVSEFDWKRTLLRFHQNIQADHIQIVAAGVAFYFFLALFPGIAAIVSLCGLVVDPAEVEIWLGQLTSILPGKTHEMLSNILKGFAGMANATHGFSFAFSLALSFFSAKKGTAALFTGINIAYNVKEKRGLFANFGIHLVHTLGTIVLGLAAVSLIAGWPAAVNFLDLPTHIAKPVSWLMWVILTILAVAALMVTYKVAPARHRKASKWINGGAASAAFLWIIGSLLFSWYVNNFGNFDRMYGSMAAVIILLLWLFLTSFSILLGAEINSELEYRAAHRKRCEDEA
ncbi:MAG: YihY/virulence factor BrkB family protein [Verrucomicrobiales bacterium]|nr:YihY/virulence factor BrkB family protein [Verrucomicrobiales bacterium]